MQICVTVLILMSVVLIGKKETGKQTEIERERQKETGTDRVTEREEINQPINQDVYFYIGSVYMMPYFYKIVVDLMCIKYFITIFKHHILFKLHYYRYTPLT